MKARRPLPRWLLACAALVLFAGDHAAALPTQSAQGQQLIVQVRLIGVGSTVVVADEIGGAVYFPYQPIAQLASLPPTTELLTPQQLAERLGVQVYWDRQQLLLTISDPFGATPAMRKLLEEKRAAARVSTGGSSVPTRSGPYVAVGANTADTWGVETGYALLAGKLAGGLGYNSESGTAWRVTLSPLPNLWLTYADSETKGPRASGRLSYRQHFVGVQYIDGAPLYVSGALGLGPLTLYATTTERYAATLRLPRQVTAQLGASGETATVRLQYGGFPPSPTVPPAVGGFGY